MSKQNRWFEYRLLKNGEIADYFTDTTDAGARKTLFVVGEGFDKRMCKGLSVLVNVLSDLTIWKIRTKEPTNSVSEQYLPMTQKNIDDFNKLALGHVVSEDEIYMWEESPQEERFVGEINATKLAAKNAGFISQFENIIIDISSMPLSIYFPFLSRLIRNHYKDKKSIFVLAAENYLTDNNIRPVELGEKAHSIHGFIGTSNPANDEIVVWIPILGEVDPPTLEKYYNFILETYHRLDEICPVLPFPSVNIKRSDDIFESYRAQLFSHWQIEKRNLIYVAENNPFQVNRTLFEFAMHYMKAMGPLGNCRFVFSAITSKLMSLGGLLAALEVENNGISVQFLGISNKGYRINDKSTETDTELYCLCLSDNGF